MFKSMPKEILSISSTGSGFFDGRKRHICYNLNQGEKDVLVSIDTRDCRPEKTDRLMPKVFNFNKTEEDVNYVNGFRVVQTINCEYAYIDAKTGELLPYRYDIASNFNQYGFAMVGKNGSVSWINKNFEYLTKDGVFIKEDLSDEREEFLGFTEVNAFSDGVIPLSKLKSENGTRFMDTNGKFKTFTRFNGEKGYSNKTFFANATDFDIDGIAFANSGYELLISTGYFCTLKDLVNIVSEKNWFDEIINTTLEINEQEKQKARDKILLKRL